MSENTSSNGNANMRICKADLIRKLTSRKFWLAIAAFVTEMIVAFHGDAEIVETVSGCIMAGATVIAYIIGEGLTDAANIAGAANTTGATNITGTANQPDAVGGVIDGEIDGSR